jgi:hypothetical protein
MRLTFLSVSIALMLLLSLVALIADSAFVRQSSLAAPALVCVFMLGVASAFSTIRAQFALRERARAGALDSLCCATYRHCLIGNLAALACASAALAFCIFVLNNSSR